MELKIFLTIITLSMILGKAANIISTEINKKIWTHLNLRGNALNSSAVQLTWDLNLSSEALGGPGKEMYVIRYKMCTDCSDAYLYKYSYVSPVQITNVYAGACYEFSIRAFTKACEELSDWIPAIKVQTNSSDECTFSCPKQFTELQEIPNKCFLFYNKGTYRAKAKEICRGFGAHLAILDSSQKNDAIKRHIQTFVDPTAKSYWNTDGIYNGIQWVWETTNAPISFSDWAPSRSGSSGSSSGNCVLLWHDYQLKWGYNSCEGGQYSFICEI